MPRWLVTLAHETCEPRDFIRNAGEVITGPRAASVVSRKYLSTSKLSYSEFVIFLISGIAKGWWLKDDKAAGGVVEVR